MLAPSCLLLAPCWSKMPQDASKLAPCWLKMAPCELKMPLCWVKLAPRPSKMAPDPSKSRNLTIFVGNWSSNKCQNSGKPNGFSLFLKIEVLQAKTSTKIDFDIILKPPGRQFEATWANIWVCWGHFDPTWRHLGASWSILEPSWANLEPSWTQLGPNLRPRCPKIEAMLAPCWLMWAEISRIFGTICNIWPQELPKTLQEGPKIQNLTIFGGLLSENLVTFCDFSRKSTKNDEKTICSCWFQNTDVLPVPC